MSSVVPTLPHRSADEWAEIINRAWQKSVETILQTGEWILDAKNDLPHGEFEHMVQTKLAFGPSTARKLMTIARHPVLSNRAHAHVLPCSWDTLYQLATKLPPEVLEAKIVDGVITPSLERKGITSLRNEAAAHRPARATKPKASRTERMARELEAASAHADELQAAHDVDQDQAEEIHRLRRENEALKSEVIKLWAERAQLRAKVAELIAGKSKRGRPRKNPAETKPRRKALKQPQDTQHTEATGKL